jgi:hypothetical protein
MATYKHGRVQTYDDPSHHGLSHQHRDDPNVPLPEHGSHSGHARNTVSVAGQPRPHFSGKVKANDSKVGGPAWGKQ